MAKRQYYNRTNSCDRCGDKLHSGNVRRECDKKGNWTGRWICRKCYAIDQNNRPDSYNTARKVLANRRTGNLNPSCSCFKGDLFEELTCRWRHVNNLNIENDNYRSIIDHSPDTELGIVQTTGRLYNSLRMDWSFGHLDREHYKKFDYLITYCASKDGKRIERIYIFPWKEIVKRTGITICENPSKGGWYEKYRIKDDDIVNKVDKIFQEIRNDWNL
jgi:hypothetical protein